VRQIVTATIDARPLAAGRIIVGLSGLYVPFEWSAPLEKIARGDAFAVPVVAWLPDPTTVVVHAMLVVAVVGAIAMVLGVTRWPALAVSAVSATALLLDQQSYSNHLLLLTLLALFLGLSGSHQAWSVVHRRSGRLVPYWPAFLVEAQVSTLYFWAGVAKINDQYLGGEVLEHNLRSWALPPAEVLPVLALLSIITEITLSAVLWIPRLFPLALALGAGLHGAIVLTLVRPVPLVSFAGLMLSGYVLFGCRWWVARRRRCDDGGPSTDPTFSRAPADTSRNAAR
jgi:hypothetical protein